MDFGNPTQCASDLALAGLRLRSMVEGCDCVTCRALDQKHDIDALAFDKYGRPVFVQWRYQPDYHYDTVTIRLSSDRGNPNVQAFKLLAGRSRADVHIQGYRCHVMVIERAALVRSLRHPSLWPCPEHGGLQSGSGGQTFTAVCRLCSSVRLIQRPDIPCGYVGPRLAVAS